jgi:S-DNA-T family DNA segregation ATPase FtsK/SpoIIIE
VVATLSDLDARLTRRAVLSLRAELLRRERVIAAAGARSLDELPAGALARLVIVVDEFAALVASGPELQDVFADLAARGRSLGLHLVLCTQRPAGVVRDAVLANIGLRISLRVTDRADALAMLGDDAAARLPADPRGRAIVMHDGATRGFQVALAAPADAERIRSAAEGSAAGAPWCDPLPERIELQQLPAAARGWAFGLIDLPAEQSQPVAFHDAATDGSLLVIGAAGAGVTTALTTLAESARRDGCAVTVLPPDPSGAWQALTGAPSSGLMIIDDLDVLLDRFGDEHRHDFAARLATVLRGGPLCVIAGIRRLDGEVSRLAGLFGSRLVLRQASREDQLLAAGTAAQHDRAPHALHDQTLPPGAGTWRGEAVQVAIVTGAKLTVPEAAQPPGVTPLTHPHIAVITTHPRADAEMLAELGWSVVLLGPDGATAWDAARSTGAPLALVGDPDDANAQWALLTAVRRGGSLVLRGCTTADHRALLPGRGLPPPLGPDAAECWLATADGTVRARITQESVANELSDH